MSEDVLIADWPPDGETTGLDQILAESFEGLYLWHARRTLRDVERVRIARKGGEVVGLAMLRNLGGGAGYVYYIAVARRLRRMGVGRRLLADAMEYFARDGSKEVYASIEGANAESMALFRSAEFRETSRGELSRKYGTLRAIEMYGRMLVVPGEKLFCKELEPVDR